MSTMNTKTTVRDDLRRARDDAALRNRLVGNARLVKSGMGWSALVFAALALAEALYLAWSGGGWHSGLLGVPILGAVVNLLGFDKFRDRVAMLESMEPSLGQSPEPAR